MVRGGEIELKAQRQNQRFHHRQLINVSNMREVSFALVIRTGTIGTLWNTYTETVAEGLSERLS
jgi:hypothetical protein